jgi:hypothetical protein
MATTPTGEDPAVEPSPRSTYGFGPRESADETRQAQQGLANDAPVDCNPNAVLCREQCATLTLMGKNFESNAMRFNGLMSHLAGLMAAGNVKVA